MDMHVQCMQTWAYPECWSSVIEEDIVIVELDVDEASPECPARSFIIRKHTAQGSLRFIHERKTVQLV